MNDEPEELEIDASKSKCWTCKYGVCIKEGELERVFHQNMRGFPGGMPMSPKEEDPFGIKEDLGFQESDEEAPELIEHLIEHERIKAVCYWRPQGVQSPPILVANVKQCSRFEDK